VEGEDGERDASVAAEEGDGAAHGDGGGEAAAHGPARIAQAA
jgi:hypothetical protein